MLPGFTGFSLTERYPPPLEGYTPLQVLPHFISNPPPVKFLKYKDLSLIQVTEDEGQTGHEDTRTFYI